MKTFVSITYHLIVTGIFAQKCTHYNNLNEQVFSKLLFFTKDKIIVETMAKNKTNKKL